MTDEEIRSRLIAAMRAMPGPYYAWPSASVEDDASVEEGEGYYAPGLGQVADALLPVVKDALTETV